MRRCGAGRRNWPPEGMEVVELASIGAINIDVSLFVEDFAEVGGEVPVKRIAIVPGGKAANVAVAAARILGPGKAALIGCVGDDEIGSAHLKDLRGEGVDTSGVMVLKGVGSGRAYLIIDERGRNSIYTFFGANAMLSPGDLDRPSIARILEDSSIIVLMDPPLDVSEKAIGISRERGKRILWDPGVRSRLGLAELGRLLRGVDYLILNEVEAVALSGSNDPMGAIPRILGAAPSLRVILKLGARGCLLASSRGVAEVPGVDLDRIGLKPVNTVGCGDAFLGAFSASLAMGMDELEALERANYAGAFKASRPKTRGSPRLEELESFIRAVRDGRGPGAP
jgi:ribokinase